MSEDRKRILAMLADGKISVDEAERLIDAIGGPAASDGTARASSAPRYFRVEVDTHEPGSPTKVNVRVPMQLLRAGVRLSALIPPRARDEVNAAMAGQGIPFDINRLKPENLEELIEHLSDFTVDVDQEHGKVRVYCE